MLVADDVSELVEVALLVLVADDVEELVLVALLVLVEVDDKLLEGVMEGVGLLLGEQLLTSRKAQSFPDNTSVEPEQKAMAAQG